MPIITEWKKIHFSLKVFALPTDWHIWGDVFHGFLLMSLFQLSHLIQSWKAWWDIQEVERLRKLQESQIVLTEGVWPPAPRME